LGWSPFVLPWTVRNYAVAGAPILLSTDGATAFFIGHNPLANGTETTEMLALARREWPWVEQLPPPRRDVEDARLKVLYAARYWLTHPRHELALIPKRLYHLYGREYRVPSPLRLTIAGRTLGGPALDGIVPAVANAYFRTVLVLALGGLPFAFGAAHSAARILPLTLVYFTLLHGVVFFSSPRYHAPMVPVLCILAALALHRLGGGLRRLAGRRRLEPAGEGA
jgi:hypothetical protein